MFSTSLARIIHEYRRERPYRENELWRAIEETIAISRTQHRNTQEARRVRRTIAGLSPQAREVLDMVVDGVPNKRIARRLHVSIRTVETRRAQIFHAFDVNSVAELVRKVVEARLADSFTAPVI